MLSKLILFCWTGKGINYYVDLSVKLSSISVIYIKHNDNSDDPCQ